MEFASVNKQRLITSYLDEKKSACEIAKEMGTNQSKIRRALKFLGVPIRSYSEAQKIALDSGQAVHPTKGKKLSKKTIDQISVARSKAWHDMTDEQKDSIKNVKREQWAKMSISERQNLQKMAHAAIRESSSIGSKTERFVSEGLENEGYGIIVHARNLIQSEALEVDMFVPELKTAIEIDGPSHFYPVWGEDKLKKQQSADLTKQGLLLTAGYVIIRIRQLDKTMSKKRMKDIFDLVVDELRKIEFEFPEKHNRLIEIEVKDGISRNLRDKK